MNKLQIRVLIVEDDQVDRMACRRALSQSNPDYEFVLLEAETGRDGLQLARTQKPDCILLDYHLPDLDGLEFLAELRSDLGEEVAVPVMMLTGSDNASVAVEALKRGAQDYLVKDSNSQHLELLSSVIQRVLRDRRALMERKQMESRLVQAEAKYRLLVEQIPAITYTAALDVPGKLLYASPQLGSALGYEPEEWMSTPGALLSHMHPDDRARAMDVLDRVGAADKPLRCEYRLLNSGGETRWFLDEARMVYDKSGDPLFVQGILVDITADKQVAEELRLHRRHIDDLVNTRTSQLEKQAAVFKSANASLTSELCELKRADEEVRKYTGRLDDFYHNAPCGFHALDAEGVLVEINDTELAWHGLAREDAVNKMHFSDLLAPASRGVFEKGFSDLRENGSIQDMRLEIADRDSGMLPVILRANAVYDAAGRFAGSRCWLFDLDAQAVQSTA